MQAELWKRIEGLYQAALAHPPEKRAEFIQQACPDDPQLRAEVQSLLDQNADSFLEGSPLSSIVQAGARLGNFELLERIGRGGMGEVWRARDTRLKRDVAIKLLPAAFTRDADRIARFEHEARAASALNHPNIISIFDVGHENNSWWIVSELVDGESLRSLLDRGLPPMHKAIELAVQIAEGLEAAHKSGIVHRDVKPGNVMATPEGRVKILDFGLAKQNPAPGNGGATVTADLTDTGAVMGTAAYMSPEQARGEELDARTDLFSFGAVLYEMATGRAPFSGDTSAVIFEAILNRQPESALERNPSLPPEMDRIIRKALEKDRNLRYQDAAEMRADLERLRRDTSANVAPVVAVPRSRAWIFAAVLPVICITAIAWWFVSRHPPEAARAELAPVRLTANGSELQVMSLAISPDGKSLAYADTNGVHVKSLQGEGERSVPNTKASEIKWWSADGSKFYFAGPRNGYISLLDENPHLQQDTIPIQDPTRPFPDGRHVFHYTDEGFEVREPDGHVICSLAEISGTTRMGARAPGTNHLAVVFYAVDNPKGSFWIDVFRLDNGRRITLLAPQRHPILGLTWVSDSHLLYAMSEHEGSRTTDVNLWLQAIDPRSGLPSGPPVRRTRWADFQISRLSASADGTKVCFLRTKAQANIWVGALGAKGTVLTRLRRLTDDESVDFQSAWTADSKAVLFTSDRTGTRQVYRQAIDKDTAEAITSGPEVFNVARLSPDGQWILYATLEAGSTKGRVMRVPVAGGTPEQVLAADGIRDIHCSRVSGGPCYIVESKAPTTATVSLFDPMRGRGPRVLETDPIAAALGISPDGKHIAFVPAKNLPGAIDNPERQIRIVNLSGVTEAEVAVQDAEHLVSGDWTADGSGFFAGDTRFTESRLLHVDRSGASQVLFSQRGSQIIEGVPSPDGHYLAMFKTAVSGNVWMVENPR